MAVGFHRQPSTHEKSLLDAKIQTGKVPIGPELELTGYGCEDAFLEHDTIEHAWEMVKELLTDEKLHDIVIDTDCQSFTMG